MSAALTHEIQRMRRDKIKSYDTILAKDKNNDKALYERGQAKFFLAMTAAWEEGGDKPFHDDITEDLRAALACAPAARQAEYKKSLMFAADHCGLLDNFPPA
ncbi:MAG: hypothetical protein LBK73_05540 [Treponema sp.]|nr:hypothetical protein [Treponema sp.]